MVLAVVIAVFLWVVAQGSTSIRYSFDIPVEIHGVLLARCGFPQWMDGDVCATSRIGATEGSQASSLQ